MKLWSLSHNVVIAINLVVATVLFVLFVNHAPTPVQSANQAVLGERVIEDAAYPSSDLTTVANEINALREQSGAQKLQQSERLDLLAAERAVDMQQNVYYAHRDQSGKVFSDYMKEGDTGYSFACENLNLQASTTPRVFVETWLASSDHKDCLLKTSHTHAGYAMTEIDFGTGFGKQTVVIAIYADIR